jgi:hypothetical protein
MNVKFAGNLRASIAFVALAALLAGATPAAADGWGHHGGWGRHGDAWAGVAAAGLIGGLALGAIAAQNSNPHGYGYHGAGYGYPAYGGGCYWADQAIVDAWGEVVEYRRVRVCN